MFMKSSWDPGARELGRLVVEREVTDSAIAQG